MITKSDLFSLEGKTALVTGATGYLGQAMAFALARAGAHVLVNSRCHDVASELVSSLVKAGCSAEPLVFDVTDQKQVDNALSRFFNKPLHILINNAYEGGSGNIRTTDAEQYRQSYEVTVVAAHYLLRAALPALRLAGKQDGDASVINIASMYGLISPDQRIYDSAYETNPPSYGASKAALIQWTRYAACELGAEGVRVNSISPGPFPSDAVKDRDPAFVSSLAARVPLGRVGMASEIQGPVLFLASPAASFVNGANLVVDGGWTIW